MRSSILIFLVALWLSVFASPNSEASTVVFENSYVGSPQAWFSDLYVDRETAEDFTLTTASEIYRIAWYGAFDRDLYTPKNFRISIYGDLLSGSLHLPQTSPLHQFDVANVAGIPTPNNSPLRYEAVLPEPLLLSPGIYWLSVQGNSPSSGYFAWSHGIPQGSVLPETVYRITTNWVHSPVLGRNDQAFQLLGVPEPSTLALFAIGCASIGCRRRR